MKLKNQSYNLLLSVCCLFWMFSTLELAAQATFPCDGSFFISLNQNAVPTVTHQVVYDGTTANFNTFMSTNLVLNATGFNPIDNYIYAINRQNSDIVRLFSDGGFEVVGSEPSVSLWATGAGDCSPEGIYAVHHRGTERVYFYNVLGNSFSLDSDVEIFWDPASGNSGIADIDFDEIVFDPQDPTVLYCYQRNYFNFGEPEDTQGSLLTIDANKNSPTFGMVSVVGQIPGDVAVHIGAMFFDSFGTLFGYGARTTNPTIQNTLISIDKNTGDASIVGVGPGASGNDGCSCPFNVDLLKEVVELDVQCDSTTVVYQFSVTNNSFSPVVGVNFVDQIPFDGLITNILPSNPLGGVAGLDSGLGTSSLIYNDFFLDQNQSVVFQVYIKMPTTLGVFSNQAQLTGLVNTADGIVQSDDPNTFAFEDPTVFVIEEEDIQGPVEEIAGEICDGDVYMLNGESYSSTGIYSQLIPNGSVLGCDSTIELSLFVHPIPVESISVTKCTGSTYFLNGTPYNSAGTYMETLQSASSEGCDSTVILDLSFADTLIQYVDYQTICPGDSIIVNGQVFNTAGQHEIFFPGGAFEGCDSLLIIILSLEEELDFDIAANSIYCIGDEFGSIAVTGGPNGSAPFNFSINGGPFEETNLFPNLVPGLYNIEIEAANGCTALYENIAVEDFSQTLYVFSQQTEYEIDLGDQVFLNITSNFPMDQISWNPDTYLSCNDCPNPNAIPTDDINYTATVLYGNDCVAAIDFSVKIKNRSKIYIPNVFSPNGDGSNDRITIFASEGVDRVEEFWIFDRWGEAVFFAEDFPPNDLNYGWDGTLKGKLMQPAVFAYFARVLRIDGVQELRKGDITLMR